MYQDAVVCDDLGCMSMVESEDTSLSSTATRAELDRTRRFMESTKMSAIYDGDKVRFYAFEDPLDTQRAQSVIGKMYNDKQGGAPVMVWVAIALTIVFAVSVTIAALRKAA